MPVRRIVGKSRTHGARESALPAGGFSSAGEPHAIHNVRVVPSVPQGAKYRIAVHRTGGCYVARTTTLPGCASRGLTAVEAIENLRSAIRAHVILAQLLAGESVVVELEISA
jgi:hypothetical protein